MNREELFSFGRGIVEKAGAGQDAALCQVFSAGESDNDRSFARWAPKGNESTAPRWREQGQVIINVSSAQLKSFGWNAKSEKKGEVAKLGKAAVARFVCHNSKHHVDPKEIGEPILPSAEKLKGRDYILNGICVPRHRFFQDVAYLTNITDVVGKDGVWLKYSAPFDYNSFRNWKGGGGGGASPHFTEGVITSDSGGEAWEAFLNAS